MTIGSERLMALTDGVVAVVITIMVLELKPPHHADAAALVALGPTFLSFALSFAYVAIYWSNHHHFFRLVPHVSAAVLWATSTCCSGCRSFPSRPPGWTSRPVLRFLSRCTASFCCSAR